MMTSDGKDSWLSGAAGTNTQRVLWPEKMGRTLTGTSQHQVSCQSRAQCLQGHSAADALQPAEQLASLHSQMSALGF